jgi:hypothetical protein
MHVYFDEVPMDVSLRDLLLLVLDKGPLVLRRISNSYSNRITAHVYINEAPYVDVWFVSWRAVCLPFVLVSWTPGLKKG